MAQELRMESLIGSTSAGVTGENADAEFRNDSARTIHIREIDAELELTIAENDEDAELEITKSPSSQLGVNNGPFNRMVLKVNLQSSSTGAIQDDGGVTARKIKRYGKGQYTLEPNESIFINTEKDSGGQLEYDVVLSYEFS